MLLSLWWLTIVLACSHRAQAAAVPRQAPVRLPQQIDGSIPSSINQTTPRAIATYVHTWSEYAHLHPGVDFLLTLFESWRRSMGHYPSRKFDLVAITLESVAERLLEHAVIRKLCRSLHLPGISPNSRRTEDERSVRAQLKKEVEVAEHSQCWIVSHAPSAARDWSGLPFVHDLLHYSHPTFREFTKLVGYELLLKAPHTAIVTPQLSSIIPTSFTVGARHYPWYAATDNTMRALEQQMGIDTATCSEVGSTMYGTVHAVIEAAVAALDLTRYMLDSTFATTAADEGLSLSEWMSDVDWNAATDTRLSEGVKPWNVAHVVNYAMALVVTTCVSPWQQSRWLDPPLIKVLKATMHDVALLQPSAAAGVGAGFDVNAIVRNTMSFCVAWRDGVHGAPGSLMHYAALIMCQALQAELPDGESRYSSLYT